MGRKEGLCLRLKDAARDGSMRESPTKSHEDVGLEHLLFGERLESWDS